jgi:hypothetical protein
MYESRVKWGSLIFVNEHQTALELRDLSIHGLVRQCWSIKGDANKMHDLYNVKNSNTKLWVSSIHPDPHPNLRLGFLLMLPDIYPILAGVNQRLINPVYSRTGPGRSRRLRLPDFLDNRHMKVSRLSVLCTGRLYPPRDTLGTMRYFRLLPRSNKNFRHFGADSLSRNVHQELPLPAA